MGTSINLSTDFSAETLQGRIQWNEIFCAKGKKVIQNNFTYTITHESHSNSKNWQARLTGTPIL